MIGDSAKKKNESIRFDETACFCVTTILLIYNSVVCWFPCTKNVIDVVYKKYRNVTLVINKIILNKLINLTFLCTKYKWCQNVQDTSAPVTKCLASEVS